MTYSSKDFAKIPAQLCSNMPSKLIHKNIHQSKVGDSLSFSAERHHMVNLVDLPSKVMSMTLGELEPGQATRKHRHNYETLIYIISGRGKSQIQDQEIDWEKGDVIYVPVWAWHQHINMTSDTLCSYIACENAPLLQNLGEIALREEA